MQHKVPKSLNKVHCGHFTRALGSSVQTPRKPPGNPTGTSPAAAEQGALAAAAECCREGDLQKPPAFVQEQAGRSSPLLLQPLHATEGGRSKRSLTQKGVLFLGSALSAVGGVQKPRTPASPEKVMLTGDRRKGFVAFIPPSDS